MTLQPLLAAAPAVQLHAAAATAALFFSAAVFLARKGTARHRLLGRLAGAGMATTAITSFFIFKGGYSWIHLLSLVTLASLSIGIAAIRAGKPRLHQRCMTGAAVGLIIAGAFTLLPGRMMGAVVFGG